MLAAQLTPAVASLRSPCQVMIRPLVPAHSTSTTRGVTTVVAGDKGKDLGQQVAAAQEARSSLASALSSFAASTLSCETRSSVQSELAKTS